MKCSAVTAFLSVALAAGVSGQPTGLVLGYQDALGQYSFGYSGPYQARSEVRSLDGVTRGAYSYVDGAGLIQSAEYTADGNNGFRVAATNLPQAPAPVQDTPEVAAARAAHLLAVEEAARAAETPQQENDGVQIVSKSSESGESTEEKAEKEPVKPAEPIAGEVAADNAQSAAEAASEEAASEAARGEEVKVPEAHQEQQGKAKAIENLVLPAPYLSPLAGSLPVPLIPVNFDLPTISAYSGRPAVGAKVDQPALPQPRPTQGLFTPAGTTLKTLQSSSVPQLKSAEIIQQHPGAPVGESATGVASGFPQYERARAVYAPVGSVFRFGYEPTGTSYLRYAPFPWVAYNLV